MDTEYYTVNIDRVIADKSMLSVTRMLAVDLQQHPYLSVGDFLKGLSDGDLDTLLQVCDDEESPHFPELIVISSMLAQAEGIADEAIDEKEFIKVLQKRIGALIGFIAIESLYRRGLVELYRENFSFGEDMQDKLIVKKIEE